MTWKQPIPVSIPELAGDPFGETLFQVILLRCRTTDGNVTRPDGSTIFLKRGQCLVGRYELARRFGLDIPNNKGGGRDSSKRIARKLENMEKVTRLLTRQQNKDCSVVTVLNFDTYVTLDQTVDQSLTRPRPGRDQAATTNKSDKNVKNDIKEEVGKKTKDRLLISKLCYLENLPQPDLLEFVRKYNLTPEEVSQESVKALDWCRDHNKNSGNFKSFLRNWLVRHIASPGRRQPESCDDEIYEGKLIHTPYPSDEEIYPNVTKQRLEEEARGKHD